VSQTITELTQRLNQLKAEKLGLERLLGISDKPFDPYELPQNPKVSVKAEVAMKDIFSGEKRRYEKDIMEFVGLSQVGFNTAVMTADKTIKSQIDVDEGRLKERTERLQTLKAQLGSKPPVGMEDIQRILEIEYLHTVAIPNLKFIVEQRKVLQKDWDGMKGFAAIQNREAQKRTAVITTQKHIPQSLKGLDEV
ncbi:MAG TPA: hypothetical protein VN457_04305, partial [Chlamydiales bacterium]|nr:hypothetical protein [Chlamydiales bacterium]